MPIYTYVCKDCGEKFDLLIGVVSENPEFKCKKCSSKNIGKILSSFNVGNLVPLRRVAPQEHVTCKVFFIFAEDSKQTSSNHSLILSSYLSRCIIHLKRREIFNE